MANYQSMPIFGVACRVTRLAADGTTPADSGTNNCYVSDKLMKIDFNPEWDEGPEVANRGASGRLIQVFKLKDQLKRLAMTVQLGTFDLELEAMLTGGAVLLSNATPLASMGTVTPSTATTGGTLPADTYGYKVAALTQYGQNVASAEATQATTGTTSTVTLTWAQIAGASYYRIYGRTEGGPWGLLATIPQASSPTWTDTGTLTPSATVLAPTVNTSGVAPYGYAYPAVGQDPDVNGLSLEVWSQNIAQPGTPGYAPGQPVAVAPYIRWVFPKIFLNKGDRTVDTNPMDGTFSGWAEENASWGNGPFNDWLLPSNRLVQAAYDTAVPAAQVGPIAIPAQV